MTVKRFVELFICYTVSIICAIWLTNLFNIENQWLYYMIVSLIGYIILTVPLTIMTIIKKSYEK